MGDQWLEQKLYVAPSAYRPHSASSTHGGKGPHTVWVRPGVGGGARAGQVFLRVSKGRRATPQTPPPQPHPHPNLNPGGTRPGCEARSLSGVSWVRVHAPQRPVLPGVRPFASDQLGPLWTQTPALVSPVLLIGDGGGLCCCCCCWGLRLEAPEFLGAGGGEGVAERGSFGRAFVKVLCLLVLCLRHVTQGLPGIRICVDRCHSHLCPPPMLQGFLV